MVSWLLFAVSAQFLFAVSVLIDKHIVSRAEHIGRPIVYAFYVSLLSGFVVVMAPFGFVSWPTPAIFLLSLLSGAAFLIAIYLLYSALKLARASDVAPVVGAISTIAALIFAGISIEPITASLLPPLFLLASGTALISSFHFRRGALFYTLAAGLFFGATIFLAKLVFLQTTFLNGFFWTRAMDIVTALSLLLVPTFRRAILHGGRHSSRGARGLVLGNKVLGGVAGILTAYAVSLGPVAVVNALSGLQFVFLFIFAFLFGRWIPELRDNGVSHDHGGWHTAWGVLLIVSGLALLYATRATLL